MNTQNEVETKIGKPPYQYLSDIDYNLPRKIIQAIY